MAVVEESSIPWFVAIMRLHNRGVIPSVTPTEYMPSRRAMAEFFGPPSDRGYVFADQGLPNYEVYVRQLFSRVIQQPWPMSAVMPFHFARGLMVEALGVEVNWADFAFRVTHHPKTKIPRILPEFKSIQEPLPPLPIVMPRAHLLVKSPLAATIAEYLNAEGGSSTGVGFSQSDDMFPPDLEILPDAEAPVAERSHTLLETARSEIIPMVPCSEGQNVSDPKVRAPVTLDVAEISALALLRTAITCSVENERVRLLMVQMDLGRSVGKLRKSLTEQRLRLTVLERKALEKSRSHDRAKAQFRRAREIMNANKLDIGASVRKHGGSVGNSGMRMSEQLVNSWMDNVAAAAKKVDSWELKLELQKELVAKTTEELAAAEDVLQEKVEVLDESLTHLHALAGFLASL